VAQALLRLGMAYEKQGDAEARKSYERLVREFADQTDLAQQARVRMAASVSAAASGPTLRRVCIDCTGAISPDGRRLLFASNGGLAVRDIVAATTRQVVPAPVSGLVCCGDFSPDGRQIVYRHRITQPELKDRVIIVNSDGSASRAVFEDGFALAWSPDATRLLVARPSGAGTGLERLAWLRVADGTEQPLPTTKPAFEVAAISPDGKYVAFNAVATRGEEKNLFLMAADGTGETRVSSSPFHQDPAGWSADGRHLVYWQAGAGNPGSGPAVWTVPVANGRVQGPALKVRQFDRGSGLGLSPTGTFYYGYSSGAADAYAASMDPSSGRVTSVPAVVPTASPGGPATFSPDARRIAYLNGTGEQRELHVFSFEDGKDQRVPTSISFSNSLCWLPRTESVLTNSMTDPGGAGPSGVRATHFDVVRVDLATGDTRRVFPDALPFRLWNCTETTAANSDPIAVKVRNIATGAETELYRLKRPVANYGMSKISPDGRFVAFLESVDPSAAVLLVVPSGGGPARELVRAKAPAQLQQINGHAWSHDSRHVYFFKRADSRAPHRLYRVPVGGGPEEAMGLEGMELRGLELAPTGRKVFFFMGAINRPEIWAMENFLPSGR
jgi:hypothetical protein